MENIIWLHPLKGGIRLHLLQIWPLKTISHNSTDKKWLKLHFKGKRPSTEVKKPSMQTPAYGRLVWSSSFPHPDAVIGPSRANASPWIEPVICLVRGLSKIMSFPVSRIDQQKAVAPRVYSTGKKKISVPSDKYEISEISEISVEI